MENKNKLDINQLLSMLDSDDLMENINRLGLMMGSPEKGENVKGIVSRLLNEKNQEINSLSSKMAHVDPAINLLLAIKPYLSVSRQKMMDESIKTFNMSFLIRQMKKMS